jgi:LysR family hydrogen peroxide-inducible transcriptional activator
LFRERLFLAVPERHRLAGLSQVRLAEIENDPFLLLKEGHCFRENTLAVCGRARLKPNVVFESGQFTTILAMVATGMGVTVVPEMAVEAVPGCRFVALADETAYRRVGVVQLKHRFRGRVDRSFLEHLQESDTPARVRAHA